MNILALDCEFNQPSGKTIEIGALAFKVKTGEVLGTFQSFVNPGELLNPEIIDLTGIKDEDLVGAPSIVEAFLGLKDFHKKYKCFKNPIVWGSGVRNDSSHIYLESGITEDNFMGFRVIDAKTVYQSMRIFQNKEIRGGVIKALNTLHLGWDSTYGDKEHRALPDAHNTFRIWYELAPQIKILKQSQVS